MNIKLDKYHYHYIHNSTKFHEEICKEIYNLKKKIKIQLECSPFRTENNLFHTKLSFGNTSNNNEKTIVCERKSRSTKQRNYVSCNKCPIVQPKEKSIDSKPPV